MCNTMSEVVPDKKSHMFLSCILCQVINYLHNTCPSFQICVKEFIIYVFLFNQCLSVSIDSVGGIVRLVFSKDYKDPGW